MSRKQSKQAPEWSTGEYRRHIQYTFTLPHQFLLLCKLMNVSPQQVLLDFMNNMSCGSWKREGRNKAREKLVEYFLEHGYGQEYYSPGDIHTIFKEMDAIGMLYPFDADADMINEHTRWRENYLTWWFTKWFKKFNRTL